MNIESLILMIEAFSVYLLVLWVHSLRHRFGLGPFYALLGGLTAVMSWITDVGVKVEMSGITFMVGSTVFYTALLLGVFVVYVFDGPRSTRIAICTVAGVSVMVPVIEFVLNAQMSIAGQASLAGIPEPSLRINAASVGATIADLVFLAMAWEFLGHQHLKMKTWMRAYFTLLGVLLLDVLLFTTGAFAGTPVYLGIMGGTTLSRLVISIFAIFFLYAYLIWQNRKHGAIIENRPVLAILSAVEEDRTDLEVAQREIARRQQVEEQLRKSEVKFQILYNSMNEGVALHQLVYDLAGRPVDYVLLDINPAGEAITGLKAAQALGRKATSLYGMATAPYIEVYANVVATGQPLQFETSFEPMSKCFHISVFSPAPDQFATVFEDITERKRAEIELRRHRENLEELVRQRTAELAEARDQAQAANRAKSVFLANMSHELRTPLTAVLGFADIMSRDPAIPGHSRESLGIIIRSGEHLLALINDILDLSKIESGESKIDRRDVDPVELASHVVTMMQKRAEAKGLRLVLDPAAELPRLVSTDPGKFRQILVNLVDNAIKFTPAGQVTIRLAAQPAPDGHVLAVEVHDTGIGIARENMDRIFHPFEQLGTTVIEGTGLGLAISRQYVQMLGGQIAVDSVLGQGSRFSFTIPVGRVDSASPRTLSADRRPASLGSPTARQLSSDDLRGLPAAALATLYRLALECDDSELASWLEAQDSLSPTAKTALATLIKDYRFDVIQELVEPLVRGK